MTMHELEALAVHMRDTQHPGADLGEFLRKHSNAPQYMVGVLEAYLEAARADLAEEKRVRREMLNTLRERERQERIARGEEMPAPNFTWIQLHLSVYGDENGKTLPKRYGKRIKALGGEYTECRGHQTTRYVDLPWTEDGQALANKLVAEYGSGGEKGTPIVIKGVDMSGIEESYLQAWIVVHNVAKRGDDPMGELLARYQKAFSSALERGVVHEKIVMEPVGCGK